MDIPLLLTLLICAGIIAVLFKIGVIETPRKTRDRHNRVAMREADEFESMTPEQQQLYLNAKNKVAEFKFSLFMLFITCIFSGAIIYYVNWVM